MAANILAMLADAVAFHCLTHSDGTANIFSEIGRYGSRLFTANLSVMPTATSL